MADNPKEIMKQMAAELKKSAAIVKKIHDAAEAADKAVDHIEKERK